MLDALAMHWSDCGQVERALEASRRSLAIGERLFGKTHKRWIHSANNLATVLADTGTEENVAEAEALLGQVAQLAEPVLGVKHPTFAAVLANQGRLLMSQGQIDEAEALLRRALAIRKRALGPAHANVGDTLVSLAEVAVKREDHEQAAKLFAEASELLSDALGPNHPTIAVIFARIAHVFTENEDYDRAIPLLTSALEIYEKAFGPEHLQVTEALELLAKALVQAKQHEQAAPLLARQLDILTKIFGPHARELEGVLVQQGKSYTEFSRFDEALEAYRHLGEVYEASFPAEEPNQAVVEVLCGDVLAAKGANRGAVERYDKALVMVEEIYGSEAFQLSVTLDKLSDALIKCQDYERAEVTLLRLEAIIIADDGPDSPALVPTVSRLAEIYMELKEREKLKARLEKLTVLMGRETARIQAETAKQEAENKKVAVQAAKKQAAKKQAAKRRAAKKRARAAKKKSRQR